MGWGSVVKRVLLVEDDHAIAEVVELVLEESGCVVERVCTVADALISVQNQTPAVVLLDLTLPGTSGIAFLRACRESAELASVPIALMSGTPIPDLEAGLEPDAVLTKPFDIDYLCTVVDVLTGDVRSPVSGAVPQT